MSERAPPAARERILYGRRKGRRLRPARQALYDTLLPRIGLTLPGEGEFLDLVALFGPEVEEVWLEIGFGAGEHLAAQAAARPEVGIIGVEPFVNGVGRLLTAIEDRGLANVRVLRDDARALLPHLPDRSVSRVFVLFPDPWPKTRHHRRRVVSPTVLDQIGRILRPGGELRLATDHPGYLSWMLEHVRASGRFDWTARDPDDWRGRPDGWPPTRYEAKALAAGRRCTYLRYLRRGPRSDAAAADKPLAIQGSDTIS